MASVVDAAMRWFNGKKPTADTERWTDTPWTPQMIQAATRRYVSGEGMAIDISPGANGVEVRQNGAEAVVRTIEPDVLLVQNREITFDLILCADRTGKVWGIRFRGRIIPKEEI